jgi:hypothetical protein
MKAQIKLFESIAVMVVFAFLLIFGVNFYFGIQKTSVNRELARASQLHMFGLAQKISFLPELDCAIAGIQEEACIDASKLSAFASVLDDSNPQSSAISALYFPVFGWSTVTVTQIYARNAVPPTAVRQVTLYNNTLPKYKESSKMQVPILIFNATGSQSTEGTYAFGYIEVTQYAK